MSTLVERLERIACGFEHESKYGDGLPAQVKQRYLNGAATIREAAAALRATTGEGEWVMVPREPTTAMLVAANAAWFIPDPSPFDKGDEARRAIYAAMLAAAAKEVDRG